MYLVHTCAAVRRTRLALLNMTAHPLSGQSTEKVVEDSHLSLLCARAPTKALEYTDPGRAFPAPVVAEDDEAAEQAEEKVDSRI